MALKNISEAIRYFFIWSTFNDLWSHTLSSDFFFFIKYGSSMNFLGRVLLKSCRDVRTEGRKEFFLDVEELTFLKIRFHGKTPTKDLRILVPAPFWHQFPAVVQWGEFTIYLLLINLALKLKKSMQKQHLLVVLFGKI